MMHIEKNVWENIIQTILNVDGKSKDNLQSRLDLVHMGIRRDLHPQVLPNGKYWLPPTIFAMSKEEKEIFCTVLKDVKVPDAYASNIFRCVSLKDRRLYSLKSHDYHILMQDLLPVALRCCMSKKVTSCIIELSNIMKAICGKVLHVEELEKVQDRAALTLCNLEKIFPPSFFTIMVHFVIHLPREAIIGGPVFYRWMYPIESYGEPIGKVEIAELDYRSWIQAHRYVLFHHDALEQLRKDSNPVEGNVEYYGLLTDIIELDYYGKWKVVLFRCDWADANTTREIKNDQFGFTMVNFSRLIHIGEHLIDEPYVFSSQVKQVFYSKDPIDEGWYVVLRNTPRDLFDMGNGSRDDIVERSETLPFPEQNLNENIPSTRKMPRRRLRDLSIVHNTTNLEEVSTKQQIVVGSSSVPETLDESVEFQITRNSHGQPVRQEARLLTGYLGIIARNANMLPINYESWHNMPDSNKNQALSNIKERFALKVSDAYIKKALGKKWRDHKSILKKEYFKKPISLEEKLQNVPPGMPRYQWEDAVRFWNSKKGEVLFGTSSRQKQKFTQTAGSRSFTCEASSGQKVGHLHLFDITHRKKDGTPMTSEAAEIMEKLKDKKAEYEATTSTDSSVNFEDIDNRIINEVLGPKRYGRVRFQGSGVNPTQYFGSTLHQYMPSGSQSQAEVQRLKDQIVQIQASTNEQISQLRAEAAAREAEAAAREAEQNRKYNELQLQLQSMMTMFQQFQNPPS
ncbi:hypothetical protein PVK06_024069 [Gossypium arboreum]|uniref:DUF4218 domain-containing protein n=1 Tax=Gossypium arboreum TaxID=29729 RepID=A0ABR0PCT0_GOSAR|nr:hypothetical protein PVK06_024069 [Gossypium arboreum]